MNKTADQDSVFTSVYKSFQKVLETIQTAPFCSEDPHLEGTDERLARAIVFDYFKGLWEDPNAVFSKGVWRPVNDQANQMVLERNIDFVSFCAHHWAPFIGHAHIAYIPDQKMVGLSKIPRVLEIFARRPQVQERLTEQLADCFNKNISPHGVGVILEAEHQCMACRGVRKTGIITQTTALRGCFTDADVKEEFFLAVQS